MPETLAGTYAALAGIEIVNNERVLTYLRHGLGPGSIKVYGDCGCSNIYDLIGCFPDLVDIEQCVTLPGNANNHISTLDTSAISPTGSFTVIVGVAPTDWTPGAQRNLADKWLAAGNQRSWQFVINSSNRLQLGTTTDGSAGTTTTSSADADLPVFVDGTKHYVAASFDDVNNLTTFYYSEDLVTFTQVGTPRPHVTTGVFNGSASIFIGGSFNQMAGSFYYFELRNNTIFLGTPVAIFDPVDEPAPGPRTPSTVVSSTTGETWTITGTQWEWCEQLSEYPYYPYVAEASYVDPVTDAAPWYSPDIPESADFLGFFVEEFEGMESPFTREVRQAIGNGGILTRSRLNSREMTWRGYLFGATCCATQYGLRWLTKTLARFNTNCRDCFGDDLELLVCCPSTEQATTIEPFRTLKAVGLVEGPVIESERATCGGECGAGCSGGSCIIEVEFTLVAAQPYFYQAPIPVYDCVPLTSLDVNDVADIPEDPSCAPINCGTILAEFCDPELPPEPTYENICFNPVVGELGLSQYFTVPKTLWPFLSEVVPVITITNNSVFTYTGIKLGFYTSLSNDPCGELFLNPPGCAVLCDELTIGYLPGESSFYIDGRTRKMALICFGNNTAFPGEKHTQGPWSWPIFTDLGFCMQVQTTNSDTNTPDICVSLSLVPRTF